jgi:hypothetical protein
MDTKTRRDAQYLRDHEARRLNSEAAKRYLASKEKQASTGLIREMLAGVLFFTLMAILAVALLAL